MALSETCGCGAAFSAERNDELKLLNAWRTTHKCSIPKHGDLAMIDTSSTQIADDFRIPELHIGFRPDEGDDDD
jgi:hypothetical protein